MYQFVWNAPLDIVDAKGLYGIDIHMGLTHFLAIKAGFCDQYARQLAKADQAVDDNWSTNPFKNWLENWKFGFGSNSPEMRKAMDPHFPIDPRSNDPTALVEANSAYVRDKIQKVIKSGNLDNFGFNLHTYQDSYSHQLFRNDHGSAGTTPDKTWINDRWFKGGRDFVMVQEVYARLVKLLEGNKSYQCHCPVEFYAFSNFVSSYLHEESMRQKEKMLREQGLLDYARPNPDYDPFGSMEGVVPEPYLYEMINQIPNPAGH